MLIEEVQLIRRKDIKVNQPTLPMPVNTNTYNYYTIFTKLNEPKAKFFRGRTYFLLVYVGTNEIFFFYEFI